MHIIQQILLCSELRTTKLDEFGEINKHLESRYPFWETINLDKMKLICS